MHSIVETPDFISDAKEAGLSEDERLEIVRIVSANPRTGKLIAGTGGARKLRIRRHNTGKSGGYRVITFFAGTSIPVFLLNIFYKGDKINLSKSERNELRTELSSLAEDYQKGASKRV